ncbi:uncharacterized protein PFL1_01566 [Pseudozyma flocculosa PF-1]|uniref:Related to glyoxaloxidase 1 n=1 Tax=Pseudozyma flocculosa TaxID=84751 RepID=A0A5C3EY24_9BASI|nr:uncharacterized protein PFL1_01566 [Pseudozyma flocculosa PF-1]EPQ30665.1 hypothetical protein PFL1_01566 [Pseudozyma flocculosa PF-1]SPO37002.1 related to glyoxaloxidase 1 [Pseudozyma flocculosa]
MRSTRRSTATFAGKLLRAASVATAALGLASLPHGAYAGEGAGEYEVVQTNSLASAMMLGLVNQDTVFILDKAENNRKKLDDGRPVWGAFFNLEDNSVRGVAVQTNTFCASGLTLGNGTWVVAGGNQAVGYGGAGVPYGVNPYNDYDGQQALRLLEPQTDSGNLVWLDTPPNTGGLQMQSRRWYPGIEGLEDGSILLIGGATGGGYINRNTPNTDPFFQGGSIDNLNAGGANPTYEYYPPAGKPPQQVSQFMGNTSGLNMYPHTFLMPSGKIFMQANYSTILWDHMNNKEEYLPDMPNQIVRVYPASAAVAMKPLTSADNYTPSILFCGGSILSDATWGNYTGPADNILGIPASKDCSSIIPEMADGTKNPSANYEHEGDLPEGRSMGQFIHLPDGTMVILNGGSKGTAGYGNATWNQVQTPNGVVNTEGMCQDPAYTPVIYDPSKPKSQRISNRGLSPSTIARLYHSSAILIPDGSVLVAGSNPHQDVVTNMPTGLTPQAFNTTYEVEKFYPPYWGKPRPYPQGMPDTIMYGGAPFEITVNGTFMGDSANAKAANTKFAIIRPGFSTHAMNMGQRAIYLDYTYVVHDDASVTYTVNPLPPTQQVLRLFVPGPALFFVTVGGVPSMGKFISVGNQLGQAQAVPFTPKFGAALQTLATPVNSTKFTASIASTDGSSDSDWSIGKIAGIAGAGAAVIALLILGICLWRRRSNRADTKAAARNSAAPWTSRDVGSGAEYKRVHTPVGSIRGDVNGAFGTTSANESSHTFESYRMQGVGESKEALGGYYDSPRGGQRSHDYNPSPLAYQSPTSSGPRSGDPGYQQQGWGEHMAGDAGAYYEDNADRYGGTYDDYPQQQRQYYDSPQGGYSQSGSGHYQQQDQSYSSSGHRHQDQSHSGSYAR